MTRSLGIGLFIFLLGFSSRVFSASEFETINDLLAVGDYQQAHNLALDLRSESEGNPEFDYLYGVSSVEVGEYHEAIFAFERVLLLDPANLPARLGLAKSYYHIGNLQLAQKHFEIVQHANPPANILHVVETYLGNMSGVSIAGATVSGYAEVTLGHDSNVNAATSDRVFTPALGAPVAIVPGGRQSSDMFRTVEVGGSYLRELRKDIGLEVRASILDKSNFSSDTYDQDGINLSTALVHSVGDHLLSAGLSFRKTDLDGRDYQEVRSLNTGWVVQMDKEWTYQTGLTFSDVRYPGASFRDQRQEVIYAGLQGGFESVTVGAGLIAGFENTKHSNSGQWARDYFGYYLNASFNLDEKHEVFGRWYSHKGIYDAVMPVFNRRRDENYDNLLLGFNCDMSDKLRMSLEYIYTDNDSNIDFFSYDRQVLQTTVRYQF